MLKEYDIRVNKDDWKELVFDQKLFMKSWIRNTELGHKSMKVELVIEGQMTNVLRVLNENHKYRHIYDPAFES